MLIEADFSSVLPDDMGLHPWAPSVCTKVTTRMRLRRYEPHMSTEDTADNGALSLDDRHRSPKRFYIPCRFDALPRYSLPSQRKL